MTEKYELNTSELLNHWNDHISFIRDSADNYDKGCEGEAKRIATSLRVLFHHTNHSVSLLSQLKKESSFFLLTTSTGYSPGNLLTSWVLLTLKIENDHMSFIPSGFCKKDSNYFVTFEDWWNEIIFDDKENKFTRKDIVLYVADKDGGAHVDPVLDEKYAKLVKKNSLKWITSTGQTPINNPAYASIRQMATEVLLSVELDKKKKQFSDHYLYKDVVEIRYIDNHTRFIWSPTRMTYTDVTEKIVKSFEKENRKLYKRVYSDGKEYLFIY